MVRGTAAREHNCWQVLELLCLECRRTELCMVTKSLLRQGRLHAHVAGDGVIVSDNLSLLPCVTMCYAPPA